MIFSTKAEYGVRLMIQLGREAAEGRTPVPLGAIAESEQLPLSYLEHLVARLRRAGLVESTRGARGGYHLAASPGEITMDRVVQALEGSISPMECFGDDGVERVQCSHPADADSGCATKMLWTRVQLGMIGAMARTTLAELVEFSAHDQPPAGPAGDTSPGPHQRPPAGPPAGVAA